MPITFIVRCRICLMKHESQGDYRAVITQLQADGWKWDAADGTVVCPRCSNKPVKES